MARFENWEAQKEKRMQVEFFIHDSGARKSRWKNTARLHGNPVPSEGESLHVINGRSCRIGAGQLLVLNPGNVHGRLLCCRNPYENGGSQFDEASLNNSGKRGGFAI